MGLGNLVNTVISGATGFLTGGPAGAFLGTVGSLEAQKAQDKIKKQQLAQAQEYNRMADFSDFGGGSRGAVVVPDYRPNNRNMNAGGGFFDTAGSFFRNVGGLVGDAFSSGIPQLFGIGTNRNRLNQPAITTVTNVGAQESQGSGTVEAGFGSLIPTITGGLRNILTNPVGQIGIGTAVGGALSLLSPDGRQIRITKKTKRLAQQAYQLSMGDLSSATSLFQNLSGIGVNEMQFVQILTKRFRNDGPVITKAALRKTRSTIRKMKNMCDMYDDLRPTARRRTPMKRARATTTLIKN